MAKVHTVYGSPGTGKSTELIKRMKQYIADGVNPADICFVGFTKASATELQERVGDLGVAISTLHSLAFRLSGAIKDQVVDWRKLKEYEKVSGVEISGANPDEAESLSDGDEYIAILGLAKARMEDYKDTYNNGNRPGNWQEFIYFAEGYDHWKEVNGYIDFNDMLLNASKSEPPKFKVMFIDEAQDLSPLQWNLIRHWEPSVEEMHIAGDDDQAIFVWGGADPHGMEEFSEEHESEVLVLPQSHRIPLRVHRVAHEILEHIGRRVAKVYLPRDEEGTFRWLGDVSRIQIEHGDDVMILFRNHSMRKDIEEELINRGLPYRVMAGKPGMMDNWGGSAVRCWAKVREDHERMGDSIISKHDHKKISSMVHYRMKDMFLKDPVGFIVKYDWSMALNLREEQLRYLKQVTKNYGSLDVDPTIRLSTIHGSKGREADHIILVDGMGERTAESMWRDPDSEYRTFYVGVTRARHKLDVIEGDNPIGIRRIARGEP